MFMVILCFCHLLLCCCDDKQHTFLDAETWFIQGPNFDEPCASLSQCNLFFCENVRSVYVVSSLFDVIFGSIQIVVGDI
jgi:hypothetical protein